MGIHDFMIDFIHECKFENKMNFNLQYILKDTNHNMKTALLKIQNSN